MYRILLFLLFFLFATTHIYSQEDTQPQTPFSVEISLVEQDAKSVINILKLDVKITNHSYQTLKFRKPYPDNYNGNWSLMVYQNNVLCEWRENESFYRSIRRPYIILLNPHETYELRLSYNLNDLVIDEDKHLQAEYTAQLQVTNLVEWLSPFMSATVVSNKIGIEILRE